MNQIIASIILIIVCSGIGILVFNILFTRKLNELHEESIKKIKAMFYGEDDTEYPNEENKTFTLDNDIFTVITWPSIQCYMEQEGFDDNATLINDGTLYDEYGDSAYLVRLSWIRTINSKLY
ncbi:hypothetical protein DSECCO2_120380 [anaerobic digester metagenome]